MSRDALIWRSGGAVIISRRADTDHDAPDADGRPEDARRRPATSGSVRLASFERPRSSESAEGSAVIAVGAQFTGSSFQHSARNDSGDAVLVAAARNVGQTTGAQHLRPEGPDRVRQAGIESRFRRIRTIRTTGCIRPIGASRTFRYVAHFAGRLFRSGTFRTAGTFRTSGSVRATGRFRRQIGCKSRDLSSGQEPSGGDGLQDLPAAVSAQG